MRGASRKSGEVLLVSPQDSFRWGTATIATLRHCSLPWYDAAGPPVSIAATPLASTKDLGGRDRLSLLAQFAAHQAFLQFAGIADGDFDPAEWVVVRKRGSDCRLIRVAARDADAAAAPPVLAVIHEFSEWLGTQPLPVFRQSWARAETVYVEASEVLSSDAAADLRWVRRSACGEVLSPGPGVLRELWTGAVPLLTWSDRSLPEALALLAALDGNATLLTLGCDFPLHRYGALAAIDESLAGSDVSEAVAAERVAGVLAQRRHVVIVGAKIDVASRRAIEIASALGTAAWLFQTDEGEAPATRWFVLAPRLAARKAVDEHLAATTDPRPWMEGFVESPAYLRYLATGEVPAADPFAAAGEPRRSYIAALALLGPRISADAATAFLAQFLFDQPLEALCIPGGTRIEGDEFVFESEAIRAVCARHIPPGSGEALRRAAASIADPERAAFLLIDAGEHEEGVARLSTLQWSDPRHTVDVLSLVPSSALTSDLARTLGHAYVECGRYRDAATVVPRLSSDDQELLLARCDRRGGDYETALSRLDRIDHPGFDALLLRCELERLAGDFSAALRAVTATTPATDEERMRRAYESSLIALETGQSSDMSWTSCDHYLAARFLTYRALSDSDFGSAEQLARDALRLARSPIEEIDARLDLIFAAFSAGKWGETRILGLEALTVVGETQGDRAASGILFTLCYLAADEGHWRSAAATLDRLRRYYSGISDSARLFELRILEAHIEFSRGRFADARRLAAATLERENLLPQLREAAALIVDEVNSIEHRREPLRSTGGSGNRELSDRHRLIAGRAGVVTLDPAQPFNSALAQWQKSPESDAPAAGTRSETLKILRAAMAVGRPDIAAAVSADLGVDVHPVASGAVSGELEILNIAATAEYPFSPDGFGPVRWAHASRNRLGHWSVDGNVKVAGAELDRIAAAGDPEWIVRSDREMFFFEGCVAWPPAIRDTVAAIVATRAENHRLRRIVEQDDATPAPQAAAAHGIVGESAAIRAVFDSINRIGRRDVAVCILGESGTGKELVARAVHRESPRRQKPFVAVNCAALPENLIESELFGHARGAFTGADRDRPGLVETSDSGTLFLDEIGEMPLVAQAKLLRFLQDGEFRRVGETTGRTADVRIITATNRRLESAVDEGRFREDLYYRIRGVEISIPPLRDRGTDVLLLTRHFLAAEKARHRTGPSVVADEVESLFRSYRWPGNVRELQNTLRAAHAMAGDALEIRLEHLPERLRSVVPAKTAVGSYQDAVARFRRDLIEKSLVQADGNQNRAAALLNMSRQALAYQIRELGILVRKPAARSL